METINQYPFPTLYDDKVVIGEFCGEQLQNCCFRSLLELVGLFDMHKICQIDTVVARKAAQAAIDKFNKQNQTRLTYDCVRNLTPTYTAGVIGEPVIYSDNIFEVKKRACQLMIDNPTRDYHSVDLNEVNLIMRSIDLTGITFIAVYYPSGFWVVYKSPFINQRRVVYDGGFCMSEDAPIPGIDITNNWEHSYSLPPEEEASLKMDIDVPLNFNQYERGSNGYI